MLGFRHRPKGADTLMEPSSRDDLTKVTVNLTNAAVADLEKAAKATGDTRTDCLNLAIQVYASIVAAPPGGKYVFEVDDIDVVVIRHI